MKKSNLRWPRQNSTYMSIMSALKLAGRQTRSSWRSPTSTPASCVSNSKDAADGYFCIANVCSCPRNLHLRYKPWQSRKWGWCHREEGNSTLEEGVNNWDKCCKSCLESKKRANKPKRQSKSPTLVLLCSDFPEVEKRRQLLQPSGSSLVKPLPRLCFRCRRPLHL